MGVDILETLTKNLHKLKTCPAIEVSEEQSDCLEALIVAYMTIAENEAGFTKESCNAMLRKLDQVWDKFVIVKEEGCSND